MLRRTITAMLKHRLQINTNCLNDTDMVQDSDGASIASTPFNSDPNQALELDPNFGDENGGPTQPPTYT